MKPAKLEIGDLLYVGLVMVVTGIVLAFGADIQTDIQDDFVTGAANCNSTHTFACGYGYNISENSLDGNLNVSSRMGTIGTVAAVMVVIGLLIGGFGAYMKFM